MTKHFDDEAQHKLWANATQFEKDTFSKWDIEERKEGEPRGNWPGWQEIHERVNGGQEA